VKGLGSEDSMGTYYKYFRLACERAMGGKIFDGKKGPDRMARQVSEPALLLCYTSWLTCSPSRCCGSCPKRAASLGRNVRKGSYTSKTLQ
jgi:hypothetical protein